MKQKKGLIVFLLLMLTIHIYSQDNLWRYVNFESGGYVMEIIPVKYSGSLPPSINNQILYARTDIGGIYRSEDNGLSWVYVSNYFDANNGYPGITPSELSIQGLAIRNNSNDPFGSQRLVAAVGHDKTDAQSTSWRSIWYSADNGTVWSWEPANIESPQMRFKGNDLRVKIGGPCILYDPNINPPEFHLYAGGFPKVDGQKPHLFKSNDNGVTWRNRDQPVLDNFHNITLPDEGIICISIKPGNTQHIWVGTTHGIIFTTNAGANWWRRNIEGVSEPYVKRIILQKDGSNNITGAMAVWGNFNQTGICRFMSSQGWAYDDLTESFYAGYSGTPSGMFSVLTFVDDNETMIIAGRYERPLRKTTNFGLNWFGENNNSSYNEVVFRYVENGHNFPAHQQRGELHPLWGYMYDGLSCLTRNPNPDWGNHWYLSGGAGPRMTEIGITNNNFSGSRWKYSTFGQAMTVNYDVVFQKINQNGYPNGNARLAIFFPLSDWTLGWTYGDRLNIQGNRNWLISDTISYDRQETRWEPVFDTYISNVTRTLVNPLDSNITYNIGGSVYDFGPENRRAACYKRQIDYNNGDLIYYNERYTNDPLYGIDNRAMVDGIIFQHNGNNNRLVVLVGVSDSQTIPITPYTGVFYSDNEGQNWTQGLFNMPSEKDGITTQDAYMNSVVPSLSGSIGDLFDGHFQLTYAGNSRVYLWLESAASPPYGGGLFRSDNNGQTWTKANDPDNHTDYFGPGTLKYIGNNQLVLAFRDFREERKGLYKGIINPADGSVSWSEFGVSTDGRFTQAEHFDFYASYWAVYGKRTGDKYNQIYRSRDNGSSWQRIPLNNPLPYFPKVHSLRIRPYDGSLWIATSGQGVWIYRQFMESGDIEPWIITEDVTVDYTDYYPMDIIVRNGATLTFTSNSNHRIDFAPGRRITIETGSRIVCNNITFGCPLGDWGGIKLYDAYNCQFDNVTFNDTRTPVEIVNSSESYSIYRKSFNNCIFNLSNDGQYCISAFDLTSLNASNCQFNMTGSPMAYGIQLDNSFSFAGGAGFGDAPPPIVSILNNSFTDGSNHLFLNCQLAGVTSFYIYGNTFYRTSGGNGIGLSGTRITGRFRNNLFSTTQFQKNITLYDGNLDLYGNIFSGNVNSNIELDVNTYARLEPLIIDDNYIWYGGYNELNMNNTGVAQNIIFTLGSFPATDRGRNCFVLNNNNYNISGEVSESFGRSYYTRYNDWSQGPNFRITQNGEEINVVYLPVTECIPTEELDNYLLYYQIIDLGNGIYDSIPVTTAPGGASPSPDKALFFSAKNKRIQRNYHLAIEDLKSLINQFDSSIYLASGLNELFMNYKLTDTTGNQNIRNQLFGELKSYLENKMQQYQSNFSIADRIYGYYLMSLVMQKQYSQAISGYENIMNNHPNAMARLQASWDRAAAILAQQRGGSGGGESSESEEQDKKPSDKIAREIYSRETANREKTRKDEKQVNTDEKSLESADNTYNKKRENLIQSRVSYFSPLNRTHLNEKIKEDLRVINNITVQQIGKDNSTPKRFHLHQNYPNPFNPVTKIKYRLPKDVNVTITIYDILGREVIRLVNNEFKKAGIYETEWNAVNFASGVYFYRIEAGSFIDSKKMVLVR